MKCTYENVKACILELLIIDSKYKEDIVQGGSTKAKVIRKYLRTLAKSKSFVPIKFIENSTKFPTVEGMAGYGPIYRYINSTIRVEVGEHWFLNHFGIRKYNQYEDFDGWAQKENGRYTRVTFNNPDTEGTTSKQWYQIKIQELK